MNIGQTAKASGISAKMIRYYESVGLIAAADRTDSGYRVYTDRDVEILHFIRRSRDLGFKVEDIRDLLGLWRDRRRKSASVKKVALRQIDELKQKIVELQEMVQTLQTLADSCSGDQNSHCAIIDELVAGDTLPHHAGPEKFGTTPGGAKGNASRRKKNAV